MSSRVSNESVYGLRSDRVAAAGLAALAFVLYAAGASRTIYVGDSGELVAAVHTLGIPHPSGYPLYVLLGKLWTSIVPLGSVAFRMSLFSALFAALAVGLLFLAARALAVGRAAALAGALLLAASPSLWGEANVQRVYALNAFFVALVSLLAITWENRLRAGTAPASRDRLFVAIAFLCGLGAANHTFLAVWGAVFLAWALLRDRGFGRRWRTLLAAGAAAAAGLAPYLLLLLRSRQDPRLDWGNPETVDALVAVVTRRDFWSRRWWTGWGDLGPIAGDFFASFASELTLAGALLGLAGLIVSWRRRPVVFLFTATALVNLAVLASHGSRSDLFLWHRYYISAYLAGALLAAIGLDAVLDTLRRSGSRTALRLARAGAIVALAGVAALLVIRYPRFDRSRYRIAESYSRQLLASLPPGAHLAANDDNILFVLIYLQLVEGVRPDVDLILQGVSGELQPLRFDPDSEPLFFTHHPNWRFPSLDVVPVGLVYQVVRAGQEPALRLPSRNSLEGEDDPRVPKDYLTRNLLGEFHFMLGATFERRDRERSLAELDAAARIASENDVLFYNLGLVYERMGLPERALGAFERSAEINPRPIPGPSKSLAADRVRELRARGIR